MAHMIEEEDIEVRPDRRCGARLGPVWPSRFPCAPGYPFVMVRKEQKDHGTGKLIEGSLEKGRRCWWWRTWSPRPGRPSTPSRCCARPERRSTTCLSVVDREEGGREKLEAMSAKLHALVTASEVLGNVNAAGPEVPPVLPLPRTGQGGRSERRPQLQGGLRGRGAGGQGGPDRDSRSWAGRQDAGRAPGRERPAPESVMITNTVKCRPPDNRRPTAEEMTGLPSLSGGGAAGQGASCVALGLTASEDLLGRKMVMKDEANQVVPGGDRRKRRSTVMVTYHPSACIYQPDGQGRPAPSAQGSLGHGRCEITRAETLLEKEPDVLLAVLPGGQFHLADPLAVVDRDLQAADLAEGLDLDLLGHGHAIVPQVHLVQYVPPEHPHAALRILDLHAEEQVHGHGQSVVAEVMLGRSWPPAPAWRSGWW